MTHLLTDTSITQQINALSELCARITATGIKIDDSLHAMILLQSLLDSYQVVQQTLLATIDFSPVTPATIANIRSCILFEELHQGTTPKINVIKRALPVSQKDKCNYCDGTGHWEHNCW